MLLTENVLKKFKNNIITEETSLLQLNKNTTSVKVITHMDLDGVTSGITMVQAILRKGIPLERVEVEFAQYGDDKEDLYNKLTPKHKTQEVLVTDFAKLPTTKIWDLFKKLTNFKADKNKQSIVAFINSRDFSKMSESEFSNLIAKGKDVTIDKKFGPENIHELFVALQVYSKNNKRDITVNNVENYRVVLNTPDVVEDHHNNDAGSLSGGKRGEIAVKSPSECSYAAKKYLPGVWDPKDLDAINMVDSAGYTPEELRNTIFLKKNFTGEGRKRGLAIIINSVIDQIIKKDKQAAKWLVKHTQPSLVSLYNNIKKAISFNKTQLEMYNALGAGDIEKVKKLATELPQEMLKNIFSKDSRTYKGHGDKKIGIISNTDKIREKNIKDVEKTKSGYATKKEQAELEAIRSLNDKKTGDKRTDEQKKRQKELEAKRGKITAYNNFAMQNAQNLREYPSRFMGSLYSVNGQMMPFSIKRYPLQIQAAKNPQYKGELDYAKVAPYVYKDVEAYLRKKGVNDMKIKNIIDNMKEESGGHGAIFMIKGFDKITPPSKESGPYYDAEAFIKKAKEVYKDDENKLKKVTAKRKEIIDAYEKGPKAKFNDIKQGCIEHAIKSVIKWTNELYPVSKEDLEKLKTKDDTFEDTTK